MVARPEAVSQNRAIEPACAHARATEKRLKVIFKKAKRKKGKQRRAHGGCLWLSEAKKDVTSCEKPR